MHSQVRKQAADELRRKLEDERSRAEAEREDEARARDEWMARRRAAEQASPPAHLPWNLPWISPESPLNLPCISRALPPLR